MRKMAGGQEKHGACKCIGNSAPSEGAHLGKEKIYISFLLF